MKRSIINFMIEYVEMILISSSYSKGIIQGFELVPIPGFKNPFQYHFHLKRISQL